MDFKYLTLYPRAPTYMDQQAKSWDSKYIFLDFSLLDFYIGCLFIAVIVVLFLSFYFLKKKYYIRSSALMFSGVMLFWAIISYFTSYDYGTSYAKFLIFSNNVLAPVFIVTALILFIFGIYRLIRKRLSSPKN